MYQECPACFDQFTVSTWRWEEMIPLPVWQNATCMLQIELQVLVSALHPRDWESRSCQARTDSPESHVTSDQDTGDSSRVTFPNIFLLSWHYVCVKPNLEGVGGQTQLHIMNIFRQKGINYCCEKAPRNITQPFHQGVRTFVFKKLMLQYFIEMFFFFNSSDVISISLKDPVNFILHFNKQQVFGHFMWLGICFFLSQIYTCLLIPS